MPMNSRFEYLLKFAIPNHFRGLRTKSWKRGLKNKTFSIISSNCVGGVVAHDFGQQLRSPTVNLFFYPDDYIKFLSNLKRYICCDLTEVTNTGVKYPIGKLDDIYIHFLHYSSFEQAAAKWKERCKRINWDNLFIIMTDRDGCTEDHVRLFSELPFRNKIIFTSKPYQYDSVVYVKGFKGPYYNSYKNIFGSRFYDIFDFKGWFNANT